MESLYFFLALLALIFAAFGFLVHAFYFSSTRDHHWARQAEDLRQSLDLKDRSSRAVEEKLKAAQADLMDAKVALKETRTELTETQGELKETQDALSRGTEQTRMLEQKVQRGVSELETLKQLAARQDEEIKSLQKDAEMIQMAVSGVKNTAKAPLEFDRAFLAATDDFDTATIPGPTIPRSQSASENSTVIHAFGPPEDLIHDPIPAEAMPLPAMESPAIGQAAQPKYDAATAKGPGSPAWKENLDNILNMLDAMEKEVQK